MTPRPPFRIFATVGTDHHPFDRLVDWVDRWIDEQRSYAPLEAIVQAGTSRPPGRAAHAGCLPFGKFRSELARADAVICHGGPGTIAEALMAGHRPLVVPRRHDLGEHVNDHQVRFARRMANRDQIVLCESYETLAAGLASLRDRRAQPVPAPADTTVAVARFSEIVNPLLHAA
jgi:UDP-N-acetylglucosamine transferase subunit ALG13